jgi:hypothetical protein
MTIHHIFHSCFVAESATAVVVYDYWRDRNDRRLHRLLAETDKQVYFVVSHFHPDHYNPNILRGTLSSAETPLRDSKDSMGGNNFVFRKEPLYLLSYDVVKHRHVDKDIPAAILRPGHGYDDNNLSLMAYRSTDIGVSTCTILHEGGEHTTIFHCGDLNNWYFSDEEEEDTGKLKVSRAQMEGLFLAIVREVKAAYPSLNHLMFPVDPRLGKDMLRGASQWLQKIPVDNFYPMHYWNLYPAMQKGLEQLASQFPNTCFHTPEDMPESYDALSGYITSL